MEDSTSDVQPEEQPATLEQQDGSLPSLGQRLGATLVQAMELARHADPRTTKRYFHNLDKLRNHAVNLSPIGLSAIA